MCFLDGNTQVLFRTWEAAYLNLKVIKDEEIKMRVLHPLIISEGLQRGIFW